VTYDSCVLHVAYFRKVGVQLDILLSPSLHSKYEIKICSMSALLAEL